MGKVEKLMEAFVVSLVLESDSCENIFYLLMLEMIKN